MKSPENSLLKKVGKGIKNTALGLGVLGVAAHVISQENPSTLKEQNISIGAIDSMYKGFDSETSKELAQLESDYVQLIKNSNPDLDTTVVANRFRGLIGKYGKGLRVVFSGEERTIADKVNNTVFTKVLRQPEDRAHYMAGTTYYEDKPGYYIPASDNFGSGGPEHATTSLDKTDSILTRSPNFDAFIAEFSHHINNDTKIARMIEYGEDYVQSGFNQEGMYKEVESVEFQAHKITEWALRQYLLRGPSDFPEVSFEHLKNNIQGTYESLLKYPNFSKDMVWNLHFEYWSSLDGNENHLEEYQKQYLERVSVLDKLVSETQADNETKMKILNNPKVSMTLIEQHYGAKQYPSVEKMKEYVDAMVVLSEVGSALSDNRFDILKKLGQSQLIKNNTEYMSKLRYFIKEGFDYREGFLETLSVQQGREYVKNIIPVYKEFINVAEKKIETGEAVDSEFGDLFSEFQTTERYVLLNILGKTHAEQDKKMVDELKGFETYSTVLYYLNKKHATKDMESFKRLPNDFYRYGYVANQIEKQETSNKSLIK